MDYYKRPDETIEQYDTRIANERGDFNINSNNLTPQADLSTQITQPAQTPPPIVPPLEATPPLQQTEPEAKAQDLTTRLQELNDKLIGKSTYQAQREAEAGIPELQKTQNDLTAQVKALANEANQIPLQLQNEAIGRGQTAGGLQPIQTAALRNNAIKSLAVNSLLASSQGNLAYAQSLADKAVSAQYGPIEEEIKAKTANLDLIIKSPDYTRAEKDRAQKQLDFQNQQKEKLDAEKLEKKNIYDIAIEAAKNGADALTLQKIQGATTGLEAAQIAAQTGAIATEKKLDTSVVEISGRKVLVNNQTGATVKDLGTSGAGGELGVISSQTQAIINNPSLFNDLTPTSRGKVISELQLNGYDTSNLGIQGLSDTAIKSIADTQKALTDLTNLRGLILGNEDILGPISGLQALNPWSKARKLQADVDRVRQTVGKALEGGVLRKEDEEKYKKILATLTDTPETALYKIDALLSSIQTDIENYKALQGSSGRSLDVRSPLEKSGEKTNAEELRKKYNY